MRRAGYASHEGGDSHFLRFIDGHEGRLAVGGGGISPPDKLILVHP
jgi:hypothetical protein